MFEELNKIIENNDTITPIKFMENSDVIYAGILPDDSFNRLDQSKYFKVTQGNGLTIFKAKNFTLKENYIIFCHTLFIDSLFKHLENIHELKNLKLITSQTDIPITENLFNKKPNCIRQWFSINVSFSNNNLIPIPLGIVGGGNKKNLAPDNLIKINLNKQRENKIYFNFNLNTNYFHRISAMKRSLKIQDAVIDKPTIELGEYVKKLSHYKYNVTPWGNGFDTHRLWESLYLGCVPITKFHKTFKNMQDLPIIFVSDYKDISLDMVNKYKFESVNIEKLKFSWWLSLIQSHTIKNQPKEININENEEVNKESIKLFYAKYHKNEKRKKYATFFRKLHKKILGKKINTLVGV